MLQVDDCATLLMYTYFFNQGSWNFHVDFVRSPFDEWSLFYHDIPYSSRWKTTNYYTYEPNDEYRSNHLELVKNILIPDIESKLFDDFEVGVGNVIGQYGIDQTKIQFSNLGPMFYEIVGYKEENKVLEIEGVIRF